MLLSEKVIIVTGASSGIGKETAKLLAKNGLRLVLPLVNLQQEIDLCMDIVQAGSEGKIEFMECDLSSFDSIRNFANEFNKKYERLDVLINNAGIWERRFHTSVDGIELTFAVNHLGPFLLTNLLMDKIGRSAPARIINVSSMMHRFAKINFNDLERRKGWNWLFVYSQSKLANIFFTRYLALKLEGTGVTVNCLHPGVTRTNLVRKLPKWIQRALLLVMKEPSQGAEAIAYLANSSDVLGVSGEYFVNKKVRKTSTYTFDKLIADRLWEVSLEYTGLKEKKPLLTKKKTGK